MANSTMTGFFLMQNENKNNSYTYGKPKNGQVLYGKMGVEIGVGFRIFFYIIGYLMAVFGGIISIAYLNLLSIGYEIIEYFQFIIHQSACLLLPIGIIIVSLSIYFPKTSNKT